MPQKIETRCPCCVSENVVCTKCSINYKFMDDWYTVVFRPMIDKRFRVPRITCIDKLEADFTCMICGSEYSITTHNEDILAKIVKGVRG